MADMRLGLNLSETLTEVRTPLQYAHSMRASESAFCMAALRLKRMHTMAMAMCSGCFSGWCACTLQRSQLLAEEKPPTDMGKFIYESPTCTNAPSSPELCTLSRVCCPLAAIINHCVSRVLGAIWSWASQVLESIQHSHVYIQSALPADCDARTREHLHACRKAPSPAVTKKFRSS